MPQIIWRPRALRDLERLFEFLEEKNPNAAQNAARQILETTDRLLENPRIGKPMDDDTGRRELLTAFGKRGYVIRYMLDGDTPVIIRIWHFLEDRNI